MKKLLLAATLTGAVLLTATACGKEEEEPKQENKQLTETQKDLNETKKELETIKDNQETQNNTQQQEPTPTPRSEEVTTGGTDAGFDLTEEEYDAHITRGEVFDLIELIEGDMDTESYKYNEPEKKSDGTWGLAFYDKETGDLAGSYIIAKDGEPFKYDEDGDLIW